MKKILICVVFAVFALGLGAQEYLGAQENKSGIQSIINHRAANNFTTGAVSRGDLDQILQAGIHAPSANNRQPWMFTVVQTYDLAKEIVSNIVQDNVLIVISAEGDGQTNGSQILDCALAAESIYLAAQALGYGSRIYTGPMNTINRNLKTKLGLPAGHSAVVLVRIGKVQSTVQGTVQGTVDAQTGASSRAAVSAKVQYK